MAPQSKGHHSSKADKVYSRVRWLGPIYTVYKIVKEFLSQ